VRNSACVESSAAGPPPPSRIVYVATYTSTRSSLMKNKMFRTTSGLSNTPGSRSGTRVPSWPAFEPAAEKVCEPCPSEDGAADNEDQRSSSQAAWHSMVPPVCRPSFSHVSRSAITAELHLALSSAKILFSSCRVYGNRADHVRHGSSSARCPRSLPETTRLTTFTDRAGVGIGSGKKWTACTAKTFGDHAAKLDAPHPNRNNVFFSMAAWLGVCALQPRTTG